MTVRGSSGGEAARPDVRREPLVDRDLGRLLVAGGSWYATFVVESGALVVRRDAEDVRRLGRGDAFGEVALLRSVPRTATVLTTAPSVLLSLRREDFVATVTGHRPTDAGAEGAVSELLAADARRGAPGPAEPPRPGG